MVMLIIIIIVIFKVGLKLYLDYSAIHLEIENWYRSVYLNFLAGSTVKKVGLKIG